jgi:hypothetical protein
MAAAEIDEALPKGGNVCVCATFLSFFFYIKVSSFVWPVYVVGQVFASSVPAESLAHVWSCDWRHFRYCVCPVVGGGFFFLAFFFFYLSVRVVILEDNECARFGTDRPTSWEGSYSPPRKKKKKRLPFLFMDTFHGRAVLIE